MARYNIFQMLLLSCLPQTTTSGIVVGVGVNVFLVVMHLVFVEVIVRVHVVVVNVFVCFTSVSAY